MKVYTTILLALIMAGAVSKERVHFAGKQVISCGTANDTIAPPINIRTAFTTSYPSAQRIVWYQYRPMKNPEPDMWYSTLGDDDYYVTFVMDDNDYSAWYDNNGKMVYYVRSMDSNELPYAVQQAINNQYNGYTITDVDLENDNNMNVYEVKLEKGADRWNVRFRPDGTVYKKKQKTMKAASDPAFVSEFRTRYPNASNVVWYNYDNSDLYEMSPNDWNFNMGDDDYEVHFMMDGTNYVAYYDNGKWIRSDIMMMDRSKLPPSISGSINTQYAGYSIDAVSREDMLNGVVYEVQLKKGNDHCKIHYNMDGTIVKRKCVNNGTKSKM
jgi:uncharacterized membrane protein YkoI